MIYNFIFCLAIILGCAIQLEVVILFSDAMIFAMALANIIGLYFLAPVVKAELVKYWEKIGAAEK